MTNRERFVEALAEAYARLFAEREADYALAAARYPPVAFAAKMTDGIVTGRAHHAGDGVKAACKAMGIKHTRRAILAFVASESS